MNGVPEKGTFLGPGDKATKRGGGSFKEESVQQSTTSAHIRGKGRGDKVWSFVSVRVVVVGGGGDRRGRQRGRGRGGACLTTGDNFLQRGRGGGPGRMRAL